MKTRLAWFLLGISFVVNVAAASAEEAWTEIRSPHFRVLTNGGKSDARHIAHEFEQMRYVFATQFPQFRLDSGAPLTIFAARDEQTAKTLEPEIWKMKGAKPAGVFQHGWEKQYVMVRLDITGLSPQVEVYHEYTHSIVHLNAHWLPTWMDEGIAEFYSYTRFEQHRILVGAPTERVDDLKKTPIPIETLLMVNSSSPYYHDEEKAQMFYGESWALVHFMVFGPGMENGAKLNRFFALLQQGEDQKEAFQQVFGDFAAMDKKLDAYMRRLSFPVGVLQDPPQIDEKEFTVQKLSLAETEAELGGFHLWSHDLADARPLVEKALKNDPKLGLAHEEEGFLLFADGQDDKARDEFSQAYALDGRLYLALFAKAMLSPVAASNAPADEAAFQSDLEKVLSVNTQFAPAAVEYARLFLRENNPNMAFGLSRRAEELEPWRAGYHLLTGQILLRMGKGAEAAGFAQYVAQHWYGPDHDEAIELWNSIPASQRPEDKSMMEEAPKDTRTAMGIVKSVTCGGQGRQWALVLAHEGEALTFHTKGPFAFGFSDTLWYGEDHFSSCHHLTGMRAVVRYRPASEASYAGDIAEIEIRDDLPASASEKAGVDPGAMQ